MLNGLTFSFLFSLKIQLKDMVNNILLKSYKFRLYPNQDQKILIEKTFGCVRFVYNNLLDYKISQFKSGNNKVSKIDCNNYCNQVLKQKYEWLKEVDKFSLTNSIYNMDNAFVKFYKEHRGFPKFKTKKNSRKSYTTNCNYSGNSSTIEVSFENNKIKLPKLKWIKAKVHRNFEGKIKSATISQIPSGKYFVSILVETEHIPIESTCCMIGVDLGIKDLLITSDGQKFDNKKLTKKYEDKLAKEQRKLSHKAKGSNNWNKQRIKVARIHEKISNTRKDYLHKISHQLVSENQVIVTEDLAVSNMMKNHNLAKAIQDCGWYELTRQLQYKSEWNNRQYIKIGRFVKSSQTCNCCGYVNNKTKNLALRKWTCPECGIVHDRDINAAINILNEGLRLLNVA